MKLGYLGGKARGLRRCFEIHVVVISKIEIHLRFAIVILFPSYCVRNESWHRRIDGRCRIIFAFGQRSCAPAYGALRDINISSVDMNVQSEHSLTLRKHLFGLPSGRMTETFAVFVQAETPQNSEETTFVPLGITATTALWRGKFPSIPSLQPKECAIFRGSSSVEDTSKMSEDSSAYVAANSPKTPACAISLR
jgi:hypothetical protein